MTKAGPNHQQFEIGVKALIARGQRVLFLLRKDFGTWDLPGGRINQGETITNALERELSEELLSLPLSISPIVHCQEVQYTLPNGNHLMLLFFKVQVDLPKKIMLSEEHRESHWANIQDMEDMPMQPAVRYAAEAIMCR